MIRKIHRPWCWNWVYYSYTNLTHISRKSHCNRQRLLDNVRFGLAIPQGCRGGDFSLEQENNPIKQYEFSKSVAIVADNLNFDSIYAYDHLIPHYKDDTQKNRCSLALHRRFKSLSVSCVDASHDAILTTALIEKRRKDSEYLHMMNFCDEIK